MVPADVINQAIGFTYSPWFLLLAAWSLAWKGIALWKAAQNGSKPWFVVLLLINDVGILEIIYIFYFANKKDNHPIVKP